MPCGSWNFEEVRSRSNYVDQLSEPPKQNFPLKGEFGPPPNFALTSLPTGFQGNFRYENEMVSIRSTFDENSHQADIASKELDILVEHVTYRTNEMSNLRSELNQLPKMAEEISSLITDIGMILKLFQFFSRKIRFFLF